VSLSPNNTRSPSAAAQAREAAIWHGAWLAASVAAGVALPLGGAASPLTWALAAAALPGAAGVALAWAPGKWLRTALMGLWAVSVAAAVILAGGLTGPLAVWSLMPLAAAGVLGGARGLAAAAAMAAGVAAAAALAQVAKIAPAPVTSEGPWLPLFVLTALGLALGSALLLARRRSARQEDEIAAMAERFISVMRDHPMPILRLDAAGAVRETLGAELAFAKNIKQFTALADDPQPLIEALERARSEGGAEIAFAPAGAPDRWIVAALARNGDGVMAVLRDATLQRSREASLEQAAADAENLNAGKSRFLANMSHELRTPLNAIIGFSDIMRGQMFGPLTEKYAEYAGLIHESGGHLLDLINDVLDMSKIEAQKFELQREDFDAREAVSAALRLMRVQADVARVQLRGVLPPKPLEVMADRRALKQIVLNLTANALKFTQAGGQVTVSVRADGDNLELVVADTGVGIAPADLQRLGRPYEQVGEADQKSMGTGLGLSLVRAFAELHGGAMSIESTLGEGTAVSVRLPVMLPASAPEAPAMVAGDNVIAFSPQR
jgi:cell cycle sensor histidine kinase DivJ